MRCPFKYLGLRKLSRVLPWHAKSWTVGYTPEILALERWRQGDTKFKVNL